MTATTFAPTYNPSPQSSSSVATPRIRKAQFGNGYSQRSQDGLNTTARLCTWKWDVLLKADYDALIAFFQAQGGYLPFNWTPPGEAAGQFIATRWTTGYPGGLTRSLAVDFEEVFDL